MLKGNTNEEKIWNYLKDAGLNDCGIAGLMGNLYAESDLAPNNLQNSYQKKLGFTDAEYTEAVDSGAYGNFVKDSAGYGLAQWTYWSRKQGLLAFAKAAGKSIGDLEMQLDFLMKELREGYASVLSVLKKAATVLEASNAVLTKYERPADQGATVQAKRAAYGQKYYDKYATAKPKEENTMSNSPLVNYTKISPNRTSPRQKKISKITIHHMAGNLSVETCGNVFAPSERQASSNYGIDSNGRVGMYVEEKDRSWCSSSGENDHQAVTIEVANDEIGGQWHVSDKALEKLIELCVDICKRNGIARLNFTGDKTGNLTMHKWFAATACPGPYLESKFPYIAEQVNAKLGAGTTSTSQTSGATSAPAAELAYKVGDVVEFTGKTHYKSSNASSGSVCKPGTAKVTSLAPKGKHPYHLVRISGGKSTVYGWVDAADIKGETANTTELKEGDRVKLDKAATIYGSTRKFQMWVYAVKLYVREIDGNRVVVSTLKTGAVTGAVDKKYLTKV